MMLNPRPFLYSLLALLTCSQALPCMAGDVYLAIRGDGGGSGTQDDPFDASGPDAYDGLLTRFRSDTDFHYAPGTYVTRGWSWGTQETAFAGCRHHGAGVDQTTIQLDGSGGLIFGADWNHLVDGFEVHDLTLDCNAQGNAAFQNGQGAVAAFNAIGNDILLQNLKVIHFGTSQQGQEDFVMFVWPADSFQGQTFNNVVFDSITFTQPATGNGDGTTITTIGGPQGVTVNGAITNCRFVDCWSDFTYSHCFNAFDCENNYVQHCTQGMYFEPSDSQDHTWTVQNNTFVDVEYGIYINWHPGAHLGNIVFDNNQVSLIADLPDQAALGINDGGINSGDPSSSISSLEFANNTVNLASDAGWAAPYAHALDLRSPGGHYTINQVVGSGNSVSLPGVAYNVDSGVVGNFNLQ
ncbi:MAG TPA: hypothetical protein VGD78_19105 [Chthoniobacterales bacterium]